MFGNFCGQSIRRRDRPGSPDDLRRVKTERPRGHEALVKFKVVVPVPIRFFSPVRRLVIQWPLVANERVFFCRKDISGAGDGDTWAVVSTDGANGR